MGIEVEKDSLTRAVIVSLLCTFGDISPESALQGWVYSLYTEYSLDIDTYGVHLIEGYIINAVSDDIDEALYMLLPDEGSELLEMNVIRSYNEFNDIFDELYGIGLVEDYELPDYNPSDYRVNK